MVDKRPGGWVKRTYPIPHVKVPYARVGGVWVRVESAQWSRSKKAFWVDFGDGFGGWFMECDLMWQTKLLFPES